MRPGHGVKEASSLFQHNEADAVVENPWDRAPPEPAQLANSANGNGRVKPSLQVQDAVAGKLPEDAVAHAVPEAPSQLPTEVDEPVSQEADHNTGPRRIRRTWGKWGQGVAADPDPVVPAQAVVPAPAVAAGAGVNRTFAWGGQGVQSGSDLWDEPHLWDMQQAELQAEQQAVEKTATLSIADTGDGVAVSHSSTAPLMSAIAQQPTRDQQCTHCNLLVVPEAGSSLEPGWGLQQESEQYFPETLWNKPCKPPYVHVVDTVEGARRAMQLLNNLVEQDKAAAQQHSRVDDLGREFWSRRVFACDTEVSLSTPVPAPDSRSLSASRCHILLLHEWRLIPVLVCRRQTSM